MQKACNSLSCTLLLIVYYVFTFRHYLTSSKLATADYQQLTEALLQIRNTISILNVINQQISRSIRAMLFLFFFVLFSVFLSFVGAKVQIILQQSNGLLNKCYDRCYFSNKSTFTVNSKAHKFTVHPSN